MAKGDVAAVVGCIRYYGGWADKIEGKTLDISPDMFHYTRPEPVRAPIPTKPPPFIPLADMPQLDRRLRSNHPLELPPAHVVVEAGPRAGHR